MPKRKPPKQMAQFFVKHLSKEHTDYPYLREIFRYIRKELNLSVTVIPKQLPYVPTEEEIQRYYDIVWKARNMLHVVLIKTLLYTGIRVSEIVKTKISDVNLESCQINIQKDKGNKDRRVPFPHAFKEVLGMHINAARQKESKYLFESPRKKPYTTRGIRKMLDRYTKEAGMQKTISPHKLRYFLFNWLKKTGIDDALIQVYSGHERKQSLDIYSKLSINDAQKEYNKAIDKFPV